MVNYKNKIKKASTYFHLECGQCHTRYKHAKPVKDLEQALYIFCPNCKVLNFVLIPNKIKDLPRVNN